MPRADGRVAVGWRKAATALPESMLEKLKTGEAPESYERLAGDNDWKTIFGLWANYNETFYERVLPFLNTFLNWGRDRWGGRFDGQLGGRASAGQVREAYNSWYQSIRDVPSVLGDNVRRPVLEAAETAEQMVKERDRYPDSDEGGAVQEVALLMWSAACDLMQAAVEDFGADVAKFAGNREDDDEQERRAQEQEARKAQEWITKMLPAVHKKNRENLGYLPDGETMEVEYYNWGGTAVVLLGDFPRQVLTVLGTPKVQTRMLKKQKEILIDDPGNVLDAISREINQECSFSQKVKKGRVPD